MHHYKNIFHLAMKNLQGCSMDVWMMPTLVNYDGQFLWRLHHISITFYQLSWLTHLTLTHYSRRWIYYVKSRLVPLLKLVHRLWVTPPKFGKCCLGMNGFRSTTPKQKQIREHSFIQYKVHGVSNDAAENGDFISTLLLHIKSRSFDISAVSLSLSHFYSPKLY